MASYRTRLSKDLDRWIENGLVPSASREPILADAAEARRIDGAAALAAVGALLLGLAAIAFVAANWAAIPRLGRFGLILALFLIASGAAAWAQARPMVRNLALLVASLIYAAAIGLTGQTFDIAGDPVTALHLAGVAAALLALAGQSSAAAMAAVFLIGVGDFLGLDDRTFPWLAVAAPAGLGLAHLWGSRPLAHDASLGLGVAAGLLIAWSRIDDPRWMLIGASAGFSAIAVAYRRLGDEGIAPVAHGWSVCAALLFLALSSFDDDPGAPLALRVLWLAAAAAVVALGMHDRRPAVTAAGVIGCAGAIAAILFDLGLGLMAASGVFFLVALAALAAGWLLRRRSRA